MKRIILATLLCLLASEAGACRELNPEINIVRSETLGGGCYAVSVPHRFIKGSDAQVSFYKAGNDVPEYSFAWNDRDQVFVECGKLNAGTTGDVIVRVVDSLRKFRPSEDDAGIEFYLNGKLVKSYTAREIAKSPNGYWATECGYRLFFKAGFSDHAVDGKQIDLFFHVETADRKIDFNPATGEITKVGKTDEKAPPALQKMFEAETE